MAKAYFNHADRKKMENLLDHLDDYLVEPDPSGPSSRMLSMMEENKSFVEEYPFVKIENVRIQ